ncbi:MAG: hypothetical protein K2J08_01850 [Ruminococcus sp.]|nr:hypothetical protein [Ruminococcus sp.]
MYSVTFGKLNGESISFDKITEIRIGKVFQELKPISENEILNSAFNVEKNIFQLIGKDFNTIISLTSNLKMDYVSIQKTGD